MTELPTDKRSTMVQCGLGEVKREMWTRHHASQESSDTSPAVKCPSDSSARDDLSKPCSSARLADAPTGPSRVCQAPQGTFECEDPDGRQGRRKDEGKTRIANRLACNCKYVYPVVVELRDQQTLTDDYGDTERKGWVCDKVFD